MSSYQIPPTTDAKEKAIGGLLTFGQFFWLLGGAVLGVFVYIAIASITKVQLLGAIPGLFIAFSGCPFAFVKKHKMPLFKYLMVKREFDKKNKHLINRRNIS